MAQYTQADRPLKVFTPLGPDRLLLAELHGHEAVSQLFEFGLHLLAPVALPRVAFEELLGQAVAVQIDLSDGPPRFFHGIVRELRQGRRDLEFTHFHLELVPRLWLWTRRVQSRIFQQLSVPDILRQVLAGLRGQVRLELTGTYFPRDYCVQYRESDFDFASRLMEEEGIFYFFEHTADGHTLVLADSLRSCPKLPGDDQVIYQPETGGEREPRRVTAWEKRQQVRAGRYTLWDYTFELPTQNLQAGVPLPEQVPAGTVTHPLRLPGGEDLEAYDWPGDYAKRFDGVAPDGTDRAADVQRVFQDNRRTARLRMEEEAAQCLTVEGEGVSAAFTPGYTFRLQRHFDGDGKYLLTRVEHDAVAADFRSGQDPAALDYRNRFTCLPADVPYRPARVTPRPRIAGTQTATVVGPAGEETFVDKHGRVKVQFHWDRQGKRDANSSCWVRVAQIWAGKRWGAFFWPRVGQEMVVAFEEGDPDQPIIVGSVYNADNVPPFDLPANDLVSGIKSCSARGDPNANYNGVLFFDRLGQEHLQLHSERHELLNTETSRREHIGESRLHVVGGLGFLGGSGSGAGEGNGDGGGGESSPFYGNADVIGHWARNLEFTVGEQMETVLGMTGDYVVGNYVELVINPLSFLGQISGSLGASSAGNFFTSLGLGVGGTMGALTVVMGADTTLVYGPEITAHRGNKVEHNGSLLSKSSLIALPLVGLYGATAMASVVLAGLGPSKADKQLIEFGGTGLAQLLLIALVSVESYLGLLEEAAKKADEADHLATQARLVADRAILSVVPGMITIAQDRINQTIDQVRQAAQTAQQRADQAQQEAVRRSRTIDGNYTINACNFSFNSSNPNGAYSTINLTAQGGAEPGTGSVNINGSLEIVLSSGSAIMGTANEEGVGSITLDAGSEGTIKVQQGSILDGTQIKLSPLGITLRAGPEVGGASISLNAETGIKLQFAEWTLTIGDEGIILTVDDNILELTLANASLMSGENEIMLSTAGVEMNGLNVDITAETEISVEAPSLMEEIGATALRTNSVNVFE